MSGHTPGPWVIPSLTQFELLGLPLDVVAEHPYRNDELIIIATVRSQTDATTVEANARLISAAPETALQRDVLLAQLKDLAACFSPALNGSDYAKKRWGEACELVTRVQDAIAKAEGGG